MTPREALAAAWDAAPYPDQSFTDWLQTAEGKEALAAVEPPTMVQTTTRPHIEDPGSYTLTSAPGALTAAMLEAKRQAANIGELIAKLQAENRRPCACPGGHDAGWSRYCPDCGGRGTDSEVAPAYTHRSHRGGESVVFRTDADLVHTNPVSITKRTASGLTTSTDGGETWAEEEG